MSEIILEFHAHEQEVDCIVKTMQSVMDPTRWETISTGNCGWIDDPDCWWVRAAVSSEEKEKIIDRIVEQNLELYKPALVD